MAGLEDHAHSALAQLVEDQVVADQEAAALSLVDGSRLVGSQLAGLDQGARQAEDSLGGIGGEGLELLSLIRPISTRECENSARSATSSDARLASSGRSAGSRSTSRERTTVTFS